MKGLFLDDRLQMRLTGFHMDRYDAQLESFVFDPSTFVFTSFLDSTSNAENYGAEFETSFTANEFVEFFANVGYLETEVDQLTVFDLDLLAFRISSGRDQAKSPNWTYNTGFNFTVNDRLRGRVEVEGRDKNFFGYYHNGEIEAYTVTHASMSYVTGNVTIQAWVRNLFDTNNEVHGLYFANDPRDVFSVNRSYFQRGEPRVFGVNLNYAF